MNILLVTMEMNIGGAETHVLELAKELKRRNHDVYVVSAGGNLVEELEESNISHIYAPLKDKKISHIIKSIKTISKIIKEKKIDIVHAHARIPGAICGYVCKKTKTHFVTSIHGVYRVNFLLRRLTNWGERSLAVSQDIRENVIKEYKLDPKNISVTVNGIDTNKFKKSEKENIEDVKIDLSKKVLMHISRIDKESSEVAEKLIEIADEMKNENIQFILVGGGNNLEELRKKAQNSSNVILTGARTDVNKLLNYADIFVGVSRAALEAMASEVPVILAGNSMYKQGYIGIFDENKLIEAIDTNFTCRGLEPINKDTLKRDIEKLINIKNEKIGQYNREIVKKYYSVEKMADDALNLYKF